MNRPLVKPLDHSDCPASRCSRARTQTVSVVIVNWRTRDALRECLRSVVGQEKLSLAEIVVIDNASGDGSPEMVAEEFPQVHLIRNEENRGFAAACNQGIRLATGTYLLLLNPDTLVPPTTIAKVVAFANKHPESAVVGCRVVKPDGTLERTCFRHPSLLDLALYAFCLDRLFPRSRFFGRSFMTWWDRDSVREVDVVTGSFMLVRRRAIDQVGLMDERYFMYAEEADWCYRFAQAGWKMMFTPGAQIIHLSSQSSAQCWPKMYVCQRRSILLYLEKWRGAWSRRGAALIYFAGSLLRLAYWSLAWCFGSARSTAREGMNLSLAALRFHLRGLMPE